MNSARGLIVDPGGRVSIPPAPLASWYTPGTSDALGDRLLMFDNTGAASIELLRFRPELADAPGFERALRERVERLESFKNPTFSEVRRVQRLEGEEGLTLVSTHTPGKRLSEMFQGPRSAVHPPFAAWLIRQLAPALADFHAQNAGVAHGALTADRIVLTPDGRVVIVEQVLGSALEELQLSASRLWRDLRVIAPPAGNGVPRLDGRADVIQLGLATLSVLLGRRITPAEYPQNLGLLLDEFADGAGPHSPALVPRLQLWLERALRGCGGGFGSVLAAQDGLSELPEADGRHLLDDGQSPHRSAVAAFPETRMTNTALASAVEPAPSVETFGHQPERSPGPTVPNEPAPDRWRHETVNAGETIVWRKLAMSHRRFVVIRNLAAVVALVALAEAAAIGRLVIGRRGDSATTAKVPVTIESPTSGDVVMVDGRQVGVTPFALNVGSSMHLIRVLSREAAPAAAAPGGAAPVESAVARTSGDAKAADRADPRAKAAAQAASAIAQAAIRQRSGGLRLSSPIEIHVFEGDRVLGSSADGPIVTTAGVHHLNLVNTALGYRSQQTVEIKAGQIVPLTVRPPDGRVSINALPWAEVWIDGNPVGETPLANVSVPVGQHEITFRHPQLGERRETTIVQSGTLTRVSATLGR